MTKLLLRFVPKGQDGTAHRGAVGKLSGLTGIVCNLLLFILKIIVGTLAGSVSITADAMNNLSDATSSVVTFVGFRLAEKPADQDHPYGHARYEYLCGLAVAALVLVIGFELAFSSAEKILHPAAITVSLPVVAVLVCSIGIKLWLCLFNRKLGKMIDSGALMAASVDSRNDVIATLAVLLACLAEHFWALPIDGYMGLAVALFILWSGVDLARQTVSPLLGESASPELREKILQLMAEDPRVLGYHDLMVHDYGPMQRFASMHVEMDHREDPMECHELIDNLERRCLERFGVHLVIHYDPVVMGDPELDRLKTLVEELLRQVDGRISVHDFRMVPGKNHTNLIFDAVLPAEKMKDQHKIKQQLDEKLAGLEETTYYTVITFDMGEFNT